MYDNVGRYEQPIKVPLKRHVKFLISTSWPVVLWREISMPYSWRDDNKSDWLEVRQQLSTEALTDWMYKLVSWVKPSWPYTPWCWGRATQLDHRLKWPDRWACNTQKTRWSTTIGPPNMPKSTLIKLNTSEWSHRLQFSKCLHHIYSFFVFLH